MSSVPAPSDKYLKSEVEPQRVGTEGTDHSLNEAPMGCEGPCYVLDRWCPECDMLRPVIVISMYAIECVECGEIFTPSDGRPQGNDRISPCCHRGMRLRVKESPNRYAIWSCNACQKSWSEGELQQQLEMTIQDLTETSEK